MPSRTLRGIGLKVLSTLLFSGMLALVKGFSEYPVSQLVLMRSLAALVILVIWLGANGEFPQALHTKRLGGQLARSVLGMITMFLNFAAFGLLPFADVTAINFASVPIILIVSGMLGIEPMRGLRWVAVAGGFGGVMLMLWEHFDFARSGAAEHGALGSMLAISNAVIVSFVMIQMRSLARTEHAGAVVFYFQGLSTLAAAVVLLVVAVWPPDWPAAELLRTQAWIWPKSADWFGLIMIGVLGGVAQIIMTKAYHHAEASVLACFDYAAMIWALVIGLFIFGEVPSSLVLLGAAVVIASGLLVVWREGQVGERLRATFRSA